MPSIPVRVPPGAAELAHGLDAIVAELGLPGAVPRDGGRRGGRGGPPRPADSR